MDYGIKLAAGGDWQGDLSARFGPLPAFLTRLRRWGLRFVELSCADAPEAGTLLRQAALCRQADLFVALHPYLRRLGPEAFGGAVAAGQLRLFLQLAESLAGATGAPAPLVFHGGMADFPPHDMKPAQAMANAHVFFRWAGRQAKTAFPGVRVFCETQLPAEPEDDFVRIGYTYEECLELVEGSDVELCWDFGHSFRSALLGHHGDFPPPEFIHRVGHVHAHDTVPHWAHPGRTVDHQPLGTGICPWRHYLRLLADAHYSGCILFENSVEGFSSLEEIESMIRRSIAEVDAVFS